MKRISSVFEQAWRFAALAAGAAAAQAQSTLPPPDVAAAPAAATPTQADDRRAKSSITGSRIRRDPLDQDAAGRVPRQAPRSTRPACPRSPTCCSACRAPAAASTPRSTTAATSATRPTAAASAPVRRRSTCAISAPTAPWCWSTACASSTARAASGIPGSVDLNTIPDNMIDRIEVLQSGASPLYGSDAIAGVVNIITVAAAGRPARLGPVSASSGRATASDPELPGELWHPAAEHAASSFGGSYAKQEAGLLARPLDLAVPEPRPDRLRHGGAGCSSASANGRFIDRFRAAARHDLAVRRTARRRWPSSGISRLPTGSTSRRSTTS